MTLLKGGFLNENNGQQFFTATYTNATIASFKFTNALTIEEATDIYALLGPDMVGTYELV